MTSIVGCLAQSPERLARLAADQNILVCEMIATIISDQTEQDSEPVPSNDAGDGGSGGGGGVRVWGDEKKPRESFPWALGIG
ncbi:MAG: hypothetical protein KAS72_09775 [Phycisphaerales bacterium]|nr:hypothetical protein [Phycisphaerales bacterium]